PLDRARLAEVLDELLMPVASGTEDDRVDIEDDISYDDGSVAQILQEAIDQIASAEVRAAVLSDALAHCGLIDLPTAIDVLAQFIIGPLHAALSARLGEENADQVIHELEPFLRYARNAPELRQRDRNRRE